MKKPICLTYISCIIAMSASVLHAGIIGGESTPTMEVYQDPANQQKLVIYKAIPGATLDLPVPNDQPKIKIGKRGAVESDKYWMWVKSAATDFAFVPCFVHKTRNIRNDLQPEAVAERFGAIQRYGTHVADWSHSYGNIEMSEGMEVEIRIQPLNFNFRTINGIVEKLNRAASRPQGLSCQVDTSTNPPKYILIKINKPGQYYIDINGQMDDYNKSLDPNPSTFPSVHTFSIFANPIMDKAFTNAASVAIINPLPTNAPPDALTPLTSGDYGKSTWVFAPGIHNLGHNFKIRNNQTYYIPGDAVVYGTMNNIGTSDPENATNIKFLGYGTLCGSLVRHPGLVTSNQNTEGPPFRLITIKNGNNVEVNGLSLIDAPYHTAEMQGQGTVTRWAKLIGWRSNNDGIGSCDLIENSFFRVADDCSYFKGDKFNCIFWKDAHAAVFHLSNIPTTRPLLIQDCELIYNRSSIDTSTGSRGAHSVFNQRGIGDEGEQNVNVTVRNFRISDPKPNRRIIDLDARDRDSDNSTVKDKSYRGITFENVVADAKSMQKTTTPLVLAEIKQLIVGTPSAPWTGVRFENVTIAGNPLTKDDFVEREVTSKNTQFARSFETPGNGTWQAPTGITNTVNVELWGGGGAGGSAATDSTSTIAYGGGGGGGCYASATVTTSTTTTQDFKYTVGSGGVGAAAGFTNGSVGQGGNPSSFRINNGANLALAMGGPGGINAKATSAAAFGGMSSVPTQTGNSGTPIHLGGRGTAGNLLGSGGGGGSGGSGGPGGSAVVATSAIYSLGGNAGVTLPATRLGGGSFGTPGVSSTSPGYREEYFSAGGNGAGVVNRVNLHKTGGHGGNGKVLFWYNYANW